MADDLDNINLLPDELRKDEEKYKYIKHDKDGKN